MLLSRAASVRQIDVRCGDAEYQFVVAGTASSLTRTASIDLACIEPPSPLVLIPRGES